MKNVPIIILIFLLFARCENNDVSPIPTNYISFKLSEAAIVNPGGRTQSTDPSVVIITIVNESGGMVLENEEISITRFNDVFLVDPILLEIGDYTLTKFLVLNSENEIIYAAPLENSALESIVLDALPISFEINADIATEGDVEVINTSGIDPEDLGYVSLSFDIIPTIDILISVFGVNDAQTHFTLIEAEVSIFHDGDSLFSQALGDSINVVKLRSNYDELELVFTSENLTPQTIVIPSDELPDYVTTPLVVKLFSIDGLLAYFPLDGNADEVLGSGITGTITGAISTEDRNGTSNSALNFDGDNDMIEYGDVFDFGTEDFTISVWANVEEFEGLKPGTESTGAELINKGVTIFGTPSRAGYTLRASLRDGSNMFSFAVVSESGESFVARDEGNFEVNEWYNVVGRKTDETVSLFVNGQLITETSVGKQINVNTNIPLTFGTINKLGNDPFSITFLDGSLDDVKFYNRALTNDEILALFVGG